MCITQCVLHIQLRLQISCLLINNTNYKKFVPVNQNYIDYFSFTVINIMIYTECY